MADSKRTEYLSRGLSREQVLRSRELHGENHLGKRKKKGFFRVFFSAFGDPIIRILAGAVCVNLLFTRRNADLLETAGILVAILIATAVSAFSEYSGEKAFEKMQEAAGQARCRVRREGKLLAIPVREVVVGDLVYLGAGERVPADGILVEGSLRVDQSPLNGESAEAAKAPSGQGTERWDPARENQLFQGSTVCSGEGVLAVQLVGGETLYGKIAREVQQESPPSPMKLRLRKLAATVSKLGYVAAALVALVFLAGVLWRDPARLGDPLRLGKTVLEALTMGITILVVAVPEGLPMMITVVLSSNTKRMLKDRVLVRKAVGIETAGSLNLLLTDKTGTLTQGNMAVTGLVMADGSFFFREELRRNPALWQRLSCSAYYDTAAQISADQTVVGSTATDRAILRAVLPMEKMPTLGLRGKLPFSGERKYSAAWVEDGTVFVKGAPERLLPRVRWAYTWQGGLCSFALCKGWKEAWQSVMRSGARVVLAAEGKGGVPGKKLPEELTLLGWIVLSDPLRPEAKDAVKRIQGAGVKVVMVTGDNPDTAASIARSCGILQGGEETVLTGDSLDAMSDDQLKQKLPSLRVVARAVPSHKSRLVRLYQEQGKVVGMTGDGINDASALKQADVGFAMGSASEIAKEAGDIVITDDNFASIVKAVLYGRTLFKSIRKFVMFQFTMNVCAVGISLLGPLLGVGQPITVLQMLWVNLIMDTLGGLAFAGEAAREEYLQEPPKRKSEPILNRFMARRILVAGLGTLGVCLWFLKSEWVRNCYDYYASPASFLTAFFVTFIFAGICNCFIMRNPRLRLTSGILKNRLFLPIMLFIAAVQLLFVYWGGPLLRTVPLSVGELLLAVGIALAVIPVQWLFLALHRLAGGKKERL